MARIRSINPSAPTDEDVATMSLAARLVWAYLPCHADRMGRLVDKPFGLKLDILPTDAVDMNAILDELAERRHIIRYQVDGRRYIQIRSFDRYQRPHPHETPSQIPAQATYTSTQNRDIGEPTSTNVTTTTANVSSARSIPSPDPSPSPEDSPPAPARDPSAATAAAITGPYLTQLFGRIRSEETGAGFEWSGTPTSPEKAAAQAEIVSESGNAAHVEASMRLLFSKAKRGELDEAAKILRSPAFAFGCWCSDFVPLVEEVTGTAPETPIAAARSARSARAGPRQAPHEITRAAARRFLEREAAKDTAT